ncbi:hypothetical protein EX30DRAFT_309848, partial [Ascodesmis nigricans]
VVRSPKKLQFLLTNRGISSETISTHLTIYHGSITDFFAVQSTLQNCNTIILSIDGAPQFLPNPLRPTLDQPEICHIAITTILTVLTNLITSSGATYNPRVLVALSSTGTSHVRDVPLLLRPLYAWLLPVAHADKREMEREIDMVPDGVLRGWVVVMPALLTDGGEPGEVKVRAGWEMKRAEEVGGRWGGVEGVAVGYTVSREDVGAWVFKEVVEREERGWWEKKVRLAY